MARPLLPPPPLLDPAWYPDPTGRYEARYWDGHKWTSHISHYGASGSDPLLRAKWDRLWIRVGARVVLWTLFIGIAAWLALRLWPDSGGDAEAAEALANRAVLAEAELPPGWSTGSVIPVSLLRVEVDDSGESSPLACGPAGELARDGADEPYRTSGFTGPNADWVAAGVVVGNGTGLARDYLDTARSPEVSDCLQSLWAPLAQIGIGQPVSVESVQAMADPSFGDEAAWWRLGGALKEGLAFDVLSDVIFVRVDNVVVEYLFTGLGEGVGVDVQRDVITSHLALIAAAMEPEADVTVPSPGATVGEGEPDG